MLEGEDNMLPDVDNLSGALELQELVFWRQRGQPWRWYQGYSVCCSRYHRIIPPARPL